nr:protein prune homolog isoform X2 [Tanacetum cinerariifolium]GFB62795.1 protein prune homolog isoform X2 [Tanacetum cinerariifolium]
LVDVVESCQSIKKLILYLKASKDVLNACVPEKSLCDVLGHISVYADSGSFISTIMYSYYLNETDTGSQYCTVPVFNNKRTRLNSHAELKWLLNTCDIDHSSILFIDENNEVLLFIEAESLLIGYQNLSGRGSSDHEISPGVDSQFRSFPISAQQNVIKAS